MKKEYDAEEQFNKKIIEPLNDVWKILQIVRKDNSDSRWIDFVAAGDKFHRRLENTESPHEFLLLKKMYEVILEAGDVIGEIHRKAQAQDNTDQEAQ